MVERCIFVVCLDSKVKSTSNKENKENIEEKKNTTTTNGGENGAENKIHNGGNCVNGTLSESNGVLNVQAAYQMLHGCNSENNSGNRWFDKTMQFIISEDGECGINYEHSPAEGIVVIELSEHLFRYM
jgi:hypothetical protein